MILIFLWRLDRFHIFPVYYCQNIQSDKHLVFKRKFSDVILLPRLQLARALLTQRGFIVNYRDQILHKMSF